MAFKFNWTTFDKSFIEEAQDKLTEALNKGIKTQMIGNIKVKELNMGTKAPELEVMEIGDLSEEKFKGIFKITYQGDAYLVIQTIVQINPLVIPKTSISLSIGSGAVAADQPLPIPIKLRISNLKLSGIAVLGFSNKGVTFCFKNDPLENINVISTFDNIPAIKKLIEDIIKTQISAFLLEDVPILIHNFSKGSNNSNNLQSGKGADTFIPLSPNSYSSSIYGEDDDSSFNTNQTKTLVSEENEIMDWKRKWIGNDLNSSSSFQNRIILYRGLKCSKYVNANRGILRLLNPSFNNYLCQSIHIDSWLITPPFSPIPLYIPKASYPSYTKDKHFSIVDYLRRTAITRVPQNHRIGNDINNFDINNNSECTVENPFKRLQQQSIENIPSPCFSSLPSPSLSTSSTIISDKSSLFCVKKNSEELSGKNHRHGFNYTHTYHRGQRKSKIIRKNKLSISNSSISNSTENETLINSSSSLINGNEEEVRNDNFNGIKSKTNNLISIPKKIDYECKIPNISSHHLSVSNSESRGRAYSNQTSLSEPSLISQNIGTGNNENVFLSLLNTNTITANNSNNNVNGKDGGCTSVNICSRNTSISNNDNDNDKSNNNNIIINNINNIKVKPNTPNNVASGYNSDGESTVCEEFPAEIVIEPSNNSMAAQLTNLMNSNQTISPYTRTLEHFAYRSFPHSKSSYKRRYHRQRHRLKIHVDELMNSTTNNENKNQPSATSSNA